MPEESGSLFQKIRDTLIGKPRSIKDPSLFHKLALIPLLAWIGLGADGLSSASYGPEEAFKALGRHTYLAVFLALATALTVFVISYAYSRIIEYFPSGGGGYIVATHTLGEQCRRRLRRGPARRLHADHHGLDRLLRRRRLQLLPRLVAVLQDPLRGGGHPLPRRYQPPRHQGIGDAPGPDLPDVRRDPRPAHRLRRLLTRRPDRDGRPPDPRGLPDGPGHPRAAGACSSSSSGPFPWAAARSRGSRPSPTACRSCASPGSTTARGPWSTWRRRWPSPRAASWSCYLLLSVQPEAGKTLNAVLAGKVFRRLGDRLRVLALITIFSEGALLLVAAQTGFVDGPRVMANMAVDYWFPHRFASLSDRFTIQNGVLLMGGAASCCSSTPTATSRRWSSCIRSTSS